METMINLNDLLKHEILDLYSVEEQIIEALPAMIEKSTNPELKKALREHLRVTEEQKNRLDKVKQTFGEGDSENNQSGGENKGFFSRLFGGSNGGEKCKGMEGIIKEGEKIMAADITDEALDAAIIASAQKVEHYEICGYGTARAFARQLNLTEVERLLTETLNEEYEADDLLTTLAVGKLNTEAEEANGMEKKGSKGRSNRTGGGSKSKSKSGGGSSSKSRSKSSSKGGSSKGGSSKGGASKGGSRSGGSSKGASKSSGGRGGSSKGGSKASKGRGNASKSGSKSSSKESGKSGGRGGSSKGSSKGARSRGR